MENSKHHKHKDHFNAALVVIFLAIFVSLIGFISEDNKITGFAASTSYNKDAAAQANLKEFNDVKSLETLAPGNYFIDGNGIVYWTDDSSRPSIAKVKFADENQKNRQIYIDDEGKVGYSIR